MNSTCRNVTKTRAANSFRHWLPVSLLAALVALPAVLAKEPAPTPLPADANQSASQDWPLTGGNLHATRYSTLARINTQNVKTLGAAWQSKNYDDAATSRATPVAKDGMIFNSAGAKVYALDARTGERVWVYQTTSSGADRRSGVPNSQGVGVGAGLVYVGLMDGHIIALDEKTGKLVWDQDLEESNPKTRQSVFAAPVYQDGILFWGVEHGPRYGGRAAALDAKTGKELWHFYVVPHPGEPGHETWPQDNLAWEWGAGAIWLAAAVDPELGLVYYGTGNPDPITYSGEVRGGNDLYTCSVIALDMKTGKLRWYYQFMHHDLWEQDVATPIVLYDQEMNGRLRKGIGAIRPDGYIFMLDRETGKPLIPIHERPVPQDRFQKTAPTQPFPDGDTILRSCESWKDQVPDGFKVGCYTAPSPKIQDTLTYGVEVRFVPMSFDPQTGYFYAQGKDQLVWFRRGDDPLMSQFGVHAAYNIDKYADSVLAAIDSRTNKIVWKKIVPMTNGYGPGGFLTTAGGLAFHRMGDGTFQAFDAKSGDVLWQFQSGHPLGDSSPITYELDGQQYVAISAANSIWAFKLAGTLPQVAPPPALRPYEAFVGPVEDTSEIQTASLIEVNGHWWVDHTAFHPYRSRVKVGAPVTFTNNGLEDHTLSAVDGSWTTGVLHPSETITLTFDKSADYTYRCKEHPWSYGELVVVAENAPARQASGRGRGGDGGAGVGFAAQAEQGKAVYAQSCSLCHLANLGGNGEAAPALVGSEFLSRWAGRNAGDLFDKIRTTMPTGAAGSLTQQQYLELVAYVLQVNEIQTGGPGLSADSAKGVSLTK